LANQVVFGFLDSMKVIFLNHNFVQPCNIAKTNSGKKTCNDLGFKECDFNYYPSIPPHINFRSNSQVQKVEDYLDKIKNINAKVWEGEECIDNPEAQEFLPFLDSLVNDFEKRIFIDKYKEMTGFPDFDTVSKNIRTEVTARIYQLGRQENFIPLYCGFNLSCSAGKNLALPGSDIDGLVFLIETKKPEKTQFYRYLLGQSINQRLLETDAGHYPEVISVQELCHFISEAESSFKKENFSNAELRKFEHNINELNPDFVKAAEFNMRLTKNISSINYPKGSKQYEDYKYGFLATCLLIENYRQNSKNNTIFDNLDAETRELIESSCLYKYSNITQQSALSQHTKDKLIFRKNFFQDFGNFDLKKQFETIKALIYQSFRKSASDDSIGGRLFTNSGENVVTSLKSLETMYDKLIEKQC